MQERSARATIRYQVELWKEWRPWAALIGIVVIAEPLLSQFVSGIEVGR